MLALAIVNYGVHLFLDDVKQETYLRRFLINCFYLFMKNRRAMKYVLYHNPFNR